MATKALQSAPKATAQAGRYLYAIIESDQDLELGPCGIDGGPVYALHSNGVAAVVSDLPAASGFGPNAADWPPIMTFSSG